MVATRLESVGLAYFFGNTLNGGGIRQQVVITLFHKSEELGVGVLSNEV